MLGYRRIGMHRADTLHFFNTPPHPSIHQISFWVTPRCSRSCWKRVWGRLLVSILATLSVCKCRALTTTCSHHMVGFIPMHWSMLVGEIWCRNASFGLRRNAASSSVRPYPMHDILFSCIGPAIAAETRRRTSPDLCPFFRWTSVCFCIHPYIHIYIDLIHSYSFLFL